MTTENCKNCRFFDLHHGKKIPTKVDGGLCRYNPPISHPTRDAESMWPIVDANDWCGHHTHEMAASS